MRIASPLLSPSPHVDAPRQHLDVERMGTPKTHDVSANIVSSPRQQPSRQTRRTTGSPRSAGRPLAWQRHSEPGPAARAKAVVAPPRTNRPGCARSRQGTEFAESRFRASRVTFLRRQRPYRRSPRSRSSGCCSARAKRSSHRCRDKRCSVSSGPAASSWLPQACAAPGEAAGSAS